MDAPPDTSTAAAGFTLSGAWNVRDVAGDTGIAPGLLFRSSQLSALDDAGRAALAGLGVRDVLDLRSEREVAVHGPGRVPTGVTVHALPLATAADDRATSPDAHALDRVLRADPEGADGPDALDGLARAFMEGEYRRFPLAAGTPAGLRTLVSLIARRRPVLLHCFAGKDRTGFLVAVALTAAGVDHERVLADYLRSNDALPTLRTRVLALRERPAGRDDDANGGQDAGAGDGSGRPALPPRARERLADALLGVRAEYLAAALEVVAERYGSAADYLRATGVSDDDLAGSSAALTTATR